MTLKSEIEYILSKSSTPQHSESELAKTKDHVFTVVSEQDKQFRGVVPAPLVEDFNYIFTNEIEAWSWLITVREIHPKGKYWVIQEDKKKECAQIIYSALADVCINDNEEIDEDFLHFDEGTCRTYIWHWLEAEFGVSVAELEA